ncbi:MAG TPA: hypothetical protein VLD67_18575, partial [Vicinamibacterales bacterium]|nr:hypothetical protein [Vicinamibacterales bacterium]
ETMTATMLSASRLVLGCCIAAAIGAAPVKAQEASTDLPPEDRWTFAVAPYLWAISLDGNAEVAGVEADVDVPFRDAVKDLSFGAMLLVDARRGRFGIGVNGVFVRTSPDDEVGPIEIDATADLAQLAVGPYYRAVEWQYGESASGRPLRLILEPYGGARLNHLRLELEVRGGPQFDDNQTWVDPIVGTRFAVDLAEHWVVAGAADVGGVVAGSDLSWNVQGYLGYRTSVFGQPTTFAIGYRALYVDYDHNEFKWDVTQQGPILGAVLRF